MTGLTLVESTRMKKVETKPIETETNKIEAVETLKKEIAEMSSDTSAEGLNKIRDRLNEFYKK